MRRKISGKLPSGRIFTMQELSSEEELAAAREADQEQGDGARRVVGNWALLMRSLVSLDGSDFDPSTVTPQKFRDLWDREDWAAVQYAFDKLHVSPDPKAQQSFRESLRFE